MGQALHIFWPSQLVCKPQLAAQWTTVILCVEFAALFLRCYYISLSNHLDFTIIICLRLTVRVITA